MQPMPPPERLMAAFSGTSLTIGPHPFALRRAELALRGVLRASDRPRGHHGRRVRVAGAVTTRRAEAGDRRRAVPDRRGDAADFGRRDVGESGPRHRSLRQRPGTAVPRLPVAAGAVSRGEYRARATARGRLDAYRANRYTCSTAELDGGRAAAPAAGAVTVDLVRAGSCVWESGTLATTGRTFRVFVSSTFSDLKAERDALQRYVFPRLRDLCLREGCRFQPIDLRWGVREEAALDQKTMSICLSEIAHCQETSPRPNFIILLGDRYGWRPLPWQIPVEEMDALRGHVEPPADLALLDRWYRRDDNAVPPVYALQPRMIDVASEADGDRARLAQEAEASAWRQIEEGLQRILRSAVASLRLSDEQREKYQASATEQEITRGAMKIEDAAGHVFAFLRSIQNAPAILNNPSARDCLDIVEHDGTPGIDAEAQRLLTLLKEEKLPQHLSRNVLRYTARWTGSGISEDHVGSLPESLDECLALSGEGAHSSTLCVDVWKSLSSIILAEIAAMKSVDPLDREIAAHRAFGANRRRFFMGRAGILERVDQYIRSDVRTPLVLAGPSGSGKSALLAQIAENAKKLLPTESVIVRFIGATPDSANVRSLLEGLRQEIARVLGEVAAPPVVSFRELALDFAALLGRVAHRGPLLIVLDALDQLSDAENARRLLWLPVALPEHVKIIVSVLPGECASALDHTLPPEARVEVDPMTRDEGAGLLEAWLAECGRTLQRAQREKVLHLFAREGRPLYLKLVFENARQWPSYWDVASLKLSPDIQGLLGDLFDRLSADSNHGQMLVSRSLSYLAAAKNGLSEDELLDVLSRDEDVFHDFISRARHKPPEQRLPVVVWSRLYYDLEPYLTTRRADGTALLAFYHRQFADAVTERYLGTEAKADRHRGLARYFLDQPSYLETGRRRTPHLRRLSELPFQQTFGGLWRDLRGTLTDFDFLQAKVDSGLLYDAVDDYENLRRAFPPPESRVEDSRQEMRVLLTAFSSAFNQEFHSFSGSPEIATQQLYSNLYAHDAIEGPAGEILKEFLERGRYPGGRAWLRRLNRAPRTSTSRLLLRTITVHEGPVTALAVSPAGDFFATGAADGTLRVWKERDGTQQAGLTAHAGGVTALRWIPPNPGEPAVLVSGGRDGFIRIWDWSTERQTVSWRAHADRVRGLSVVGNSERLVSCGDDHLVRIWHWPTGREERTLRGHKDRVFCVAANAQDGLIVSGGEDKTLKVWTMHQAAESHTLRGHDSAVHCVALEPGSRWAASGSEDGQLKTWDLQARREHRSIMAHRRRVTDVAITLDGTQIATAGEDAIVRIWDAPTTELVHSYPGHGSAVRALAFDPDRRWIASAGDDGTLRIWSLQEKRRREEPSWEHDGSVLWMQHGEDGGFVATGGDNHSIRIWNERDGAPRVALRGHMGAVLAVVSPDDNDILISAGADRTIKVWQLSTAKLLRTLGSQLAGVVAAGSLTAPKGGHTGPVTCLAQVDGDVVLSGSKDGTLRLWNFRSGEELRIFQGAKGLIESVAVGLAGRIIATAGTSKEIVLWDVHTGRVQACLTGHDSNVTCLALSPDGTRLFSGSLDRTIRTWDVPEGKSAVFQGHADRVNAVAFDPQTRVVVSASHDTTVRIWDVESGRSLHVLSGHHAPVRCLAVDAAAGRLLSGSDDGFVNVWDLRDGGRLARIQLGAPVAAVLVLPGMNICAGLKNGGVAFLALSLSEGE